MPEGDSIFRHAARLAPRFGGKKVSALFARGVAYPGLVGETIGTIEARGKHLVIPVGTRAVVHVHLGMNGRVREIPASEWTPWRAAQATLALRAGDWAALWSSARTVEVLRAAFVHAHPGLRRLGPSLLDEEFVVGEVIARARARDGGTTLAELLLDQSVAAGIGNVYKCESLWVEKLNPWTPVGEVDDATLVRLYETARRLMRSNVGSGPRVTTKSGPRRYYVYRRTEDLCPVCGTRVEGRQQGEPARMTYFCAQCQGVRAGER
jgi:endonuclease-8